MAYQCDPCLCPEQHYRNTESFKKSVITLLCRIIEAIGAGGSTTPEEASFPALYSIAGASIIGAYTIVANLVDARIFVLDNDTNGDVYVSMDAGATDSFYLKASDKLTIDLTANGMISTAEIHVKAGASAPTSGIFTVSQVVV